MSNITRYEGKTDDQEIETIDFKPDDKNMDPVVETAIKAIAEAIASMAVLYVWSQILKK